MLGCGWLSESERLAGDRPFPEATACPGYSIQMPEVVEAARARSWGSRGGLLPLYGAQRLPPVAVDAIDALEVACGEVQSRTLREQREAVRDGAG